MKKTICILGILLCAAALFAVQNGETVYVAVKKAAIKSGTGNFDKVVAQASYGDELVVDKASNKFHRVHKASDPSITGWIPATSVTTKKIIASSKKVTASADEIALAGKGFNSTIEAVYAEQFEVNFEIVDYIESLGANTEDAVIFAQQGKLNDGGAE